MTIGVMFNTDRLAGEDLVSFARRVEEAGIDTMWVPELFGREPIAAAAWLLAATDRLRVATGIANVYARDAVAASAAARTLGELSGDRFVLGLGVSNAGLVGMRGHTWEPPLSKLAAYLDEMQAAQLAGPAPSRVTPVHVAAHGPKMVELVAARCDGLSTYLQSPEHTALVRSSLSEGQELNVTQMCLLCDDPVEARRLGRKAIAFYVGLDYYHRAWRTQGFDESDWAGGGSDRLVDMLVAWGDEHTIEARLRAHTDAGANEMVIIPLNPAGGGEPHWPVLEAVVSMNWSDEI
ncbi:MAG: TIGR03620 family F420-dependent LLM class oxidoreductase [Acidimicrobiales bacterium]